MTAKFGSIILPLLMWQGAFVDGPQTLSFGISPEQQFDFPPGRELQPGPPHDPQLAAQHILPPGVATPPNSAQGSAVGAAVVVGIVVGAAVVVGVVVGASVVVGATVVVCDY